MSIVPYIEETDGKEYFKVRVVRKSSKNPSHRVDKTLLGFKTEADAQKAEMRLLVECERALSKLESRGVVFGELLDEWELAARRGDIFIRELAKQTAEDYVFIIRKYCDEWMKLSVHEIDRARAWVLLDRVERDVSVARRKRFRTALDAVFRWGMLSGRIKNLTSIPTEGFSSTRRDEEKMPEILNLEQIRTLLQYAEELQHPWYPHWALALYTGMRAGELYALEWESIDFDNKLIFVHRNWQTRTGYGPTKGRYWRAVPIESDQVLKFLRELRTKRAGEKYVLPHFNMWSKGAQARILREFCQGTGLPSIRFHTLRACFATQLIRDGIAPAVVMKICGWRDLKTMQRYIRLAGIEIKGATQGLKLLPERDVMGRVVELFRQK